MFHKSMTVTIPHFENHCFKYMPSYITLLWSIWKWLLIYATVLFFPPFPSFCTIQMQILPEQLQPQAAAKHLQFRMVLLSACWGRTRTATRATPISPVMVMETMSDVKYSTRAGTLSRNTFMDCWFPVVPARNWIVHDNIWKKKIMLTVVYFSCFLIDLVLCIDSLSHMFSPCVSFWAVNIKGLNSQCLVVDLPEIWIWRFWVQIPAMWCGIEWGP